MYVIMRNDGKYVARPGSKHSYCKSIERARVYRDKVDAIVDRCPGNETVVPVDSIINTGMN